MFRSIVLFLTLVSLASFSVSANEGNSLLARQDMTSSSSSSASMSPSSTSSASSSSSTCNPSNQLSAGQSASWTSTTASTCCTSSTSSTCYFRTQSDVSSTQACIIPNCADLSSGDESKMIGFKPLSSNTGSGMMNNTFNITPVNTAHSNTLRVVKVPGTEIVLLNSAVAAIGAVAFTLACLLFV
ncbi:unnamed protein product [Sympodiomycopsis kandeliae]